VLILEFSPLALVNFGIVALDVYPSELYLSVFLLLKILQFNFFGCVAHGVVISAVWPFSWLGLHVLIYHIGTNCKALSLN